ncbi:ASST-domain-containing protein [Aspergillus karnatakaensis]|uniref:arylsulfotransferase family protein n=1 Tax=Aspergillus karnatakaensis TaxID=1810916 RepID=UPI003CCE0E90
MWRSFLLATSLLKLVSADIPIRPEPAGEWPTELYHSTSIQGTSVYYVKRDPRCQNGQYTLLTPHGEGVAARSPTIVDQDGQLVWAGEDIYEPTANLDVHTYKGRQYLTFWSGSTDVEGHGDGVVHMLDSSYNEVYKIRGPNGDSVDLHEFQITLDDTALFTVYDVVNVDHQPDDGRYDSWVWDSRFVEIDIETDRVLFEWRASEHVNFSQVIRETENPDWSYSTAWDFFHLHSVDKDAKGNYLVSARQVDYLIYIDGHTGEILWRLGGNHSNFTDLSGGNASTFAWPQHARFRDDGKSITLFDNASPDSRANRGLYLDIDQTEMTVQLRHEYRAFEHWAITPEARSQSQGSVQVLDNGNVLVSYGLNGAAWTEFSQSGTPLCHAEFGSVSSFGTGSPSSYRASKRSWKGHPSTTPDFEITGYTAAVSWNGATEITHWVLEGSETALPSPYPNAHSNSNPNYGNGNYPNPYSDTSDAYFTKIATVEKAGFETLIPIPFNADYPYLRVRALDERGYILGTTAILPFHRFTVDPYAPSRPSRVITRHSPALFFAGACATLGAIACIWLFRRYCCAVCLHGIWRLRRGRYQSLRSGPQDADGDWEEYYAGEDQEAGVHLVSDTESDSSDVEISELDNPRLSPGFVRSPTRLSTGSGARPGLTRTPSMQSTASERAKQH